MSNPTRREREERLIVDAHYCGRCEDLAGALEAAHRREDAVRKHLAQIPVDPSSASTDYLAGWYKGLNCAKEHILATLDGDEGAQFKEKYHA